MKKDKITKTIHTYIEERNKILKKMDVEEMKKFCQEYGIELPPNPESLIAGMHKTRIHSPSFTEEEKTISKNWLLENDFTTEM